MNASKRRDESKPKPKRTRKHRSRPVPKWLQERQDLDEMARRRCLLILSVLSGVKPVSEAIAETGLSRNTYYQLEEKALEGMLAALGPTPPGRKPDQSAEIAALEAKVARMEEEKRRAERLLLLTQKVVRKGRLTLPGRGRPRSTQSGEKPSSGSETTSPRTIGLPSTPRPGADAL
jgi:hypothetical protein